MGNDTPSVGRTVHYVAYGTPGGEFPAGKCRAAIITEVAEFGVSPTEQIAIDGEGHVTTVGLCVLNPTGLYFNRGIQYSDANIPGTWHWPERT